MTYPNREQAQAAAILRLTREQCVKGRHASYCEHREGVRSPLHPNYRAR